MTDTTLSAAREAVTSLHLVGANAQVASVWMAGWRNDRPPTMQRFCERLGWDHTPGVAIFEVSDSAIMCVQAGSYYKIALSFDLTGHDLLEMTDTASRKERLDWFKRVVRGAVAVSHRSFKSEGGKNRLAQGVSMPLSGKSESGNFYYLAHSNWRPVGTDWEIGSVFADRQPTLEKFMCSYISNASPSVAAA